MPRRARPRDPRVDGGQPRASWRARSTGSRSRSPASPTGARQLREHRQQAIVGAAVAGFVIGGGIAAVTGLFRRGR